MARILVTGGAGFLGSHICELLLARGHEVIALDNLFTGRRKNIEHLIGRDGFEFVRADVCDPFHFEVDQLFHMACPASPIHYQRNPARTAKTAVMGTVHALECARDAGARILIASTSEVYGDPAMHPQHEGYWGNVNPIGPRACYDEGKRVGETLAVDYARQYGVEVRIARIFNTYGPRMAEQDGRVVSTFICQALRNQPVTIFGDGSQTRSFCYVDDLVDGLLRLMDDDGEQRLIHEGKSELVYGNTQASPVNLGNPIEFTIAELADQVASIVGRPLKVERRELPIDDPCRRRPNIEKAQRLLDWNPRIPLDTGLRCTVEYFKRQISMARAEEFAAPERL